MKSLFASSLPALAASALFLAAGSTSANAGDYTWDTVSGDGATITAGSGAWSTTGTNWNNGTTNVVWAQTSGSAALHNAIFAGTDGTYTVTLSGTTNAQSVAFNNSGYTLTSGTLSLRPTTTTNGNITVAAGKTATINSNIGFSNNAATTITSGSGSTLNLGGGASNSQYTFTGAGTINMTAGSYTANVGNLKVATFNQTGGTFNMNPPIASGGQYAIGWNAGQSVTYTMSGTAIINANSGSASGTNAFLAIGRGSGTNAYTNTLNVTGTANLNVGNSASGRPGELLIASTADSNGTLNVTQSSAVTVGQSSTAGFTDNKIYFFKNGSNPGYTANLTQSGGTVTAVNGIQFGGTAGSYDGSSSANLTLSGGALYVGAQGITRGSGASTLPISIKLQGGTIGASGDWSSSLNMKIGTATIRGGTPTSANNITLSGVLSDDTGPGSITKFGSGTLTLSGSNTYTGSTTITQATMALGANNVLPNTTNVSIGAATLDAASFADTVGTLDPTTATSTINLGSGAALEFADSSAVDWTGGTLNITGNFVRGASLRFGTNNSGLTATQLGKISSLGLSNFILDENGYLTTGDSTEPTLVSIVDNMEGGPIPVNTTVTYTVTFSEAIEPTSISADDFLNAGDAVCTIGAFTQVSSSVYTMQVTPSTVGTLILQIPTTASILDAANNALVCDPALNDDTTITVNNSPAPTISASNIADDKTGQIVAPNMVVTYTLTFSEDIDHTTVTAADFGNAGTATITIGTITETSPGVFTVQVTPTSTGTLQFKINAGAVIKAASSGGVSPGNVLNTTSAITDADTITVGSYLFWDTVSGDGSALTSGTGTWNTTAGNAVWNNVVGNVPWTQTSTIVGSNNAVFAGTDGTANQYAITVSGSVAAQSLTFSNSGYRLSGGTVSVATSSTTNGNITVAAGKTATINSAINFIDNKATTFTANSGATLNLGGGASNSQYTFTGAGTFNMTAGTYDADVGSMNAATFNQTGGTFNMTLPVSSGGGYVIGRTAGRSVVYNLSSGTMNAIANLTSASNAFLAIGRASGNTAYTNTLNVSNSGVLNVGTTAGRSGEIQLGYDTTSNGTLNVSGGTVTVGTGTTGNQIYFFKAGSGAGYTANMTQSAGTVTANGIQFGGTGGTYNATSAANLTLSGGALYVGVQGITLGSGASTLPIAIKLQGGTIGASDNWSSSLDMKLGTTGGGPIFQAATSGTVSKNITLSGVLSNDAAVNGKLTKTGAGTLTLSGTGANTFTGATLVSAGTLELGKVDAVSSSSGLTIASGAALSLSSTSSTVNSLTFSNTGTLNFNVAAGGYNLTVNNTDGVTNSGAAGSVTINITGSAPENGTYTLIDYNGTLQGSGFSAYTLGTTPTGKYFELANDTATGTVQLVVSGVYTWTGLASSEWSTNVIADPKNWTKDGSAIDYANDFPVYFDSTATNKTVEITGTNVTPLSVTVISGTYTLQGSNAIAGPAPVAVSSGAILKLGSPNVLPNGVGTGNVTLSGTLDLNGYSDTINGLTGSGTVDNTAAATTSTLSLGDNANGNFSGAIKNTVGTLALTKTGATDITLSGSNTYNGATTINQGRLFLSSTNALSPNTAVTVNNGASLILNATGTYAPSITLNSGANLAQRQVATLSNVTLPASGTATFNIDNAATQAFTLASNQTLGGSLNVQVGGGAGAAGSVTLSGTLSGSGGSLVKSGTGQLTLRGANTFTGGVTIKNGTLESAATQTTLGTGTVTMGGAGSTGATFITGQPNSNPFVINAPTSGSVVIGTNGAGSGFTMSGGVTLNGNLTLQTFENAISGSTKSSAIVTGGVTGTGNLSLNNLGLAANLITISGSSVNHTGTITLSGTAATGDTTISAPIGANVTGITQNSATSTLVLSGSNSYAGNLTINAGTVRISNNSNTANDVSTVTIASGGTLNLTYAGTDMVDRLIIGGIEQPAGIYGPSATNISQITGTGTLTVGAPEIAVEQPVDTNIASGGSQDFGSVEVGSNTSLTFTVRNSGDLALNLTGTPAVAVSGANAGDFTVTAAPSSTVAAASTTTFTVQFAPSAEGVRNAALSIANNDSNEGTFVINLSGTGTVVSDPFAAWSGGAAFDADANGDGVSNGLAWILGAADANTNAGGLLPSASIIGDDIVFTFQRNQESINANTALTIEVGTTLGAWPDAYNVGADTNGSSVGVSVVQDSPSAGTDTVTLTIPRAPDDKKFVRLKAVLTP